MKLLKIKKNNKVYKYEPQKKYVDDMLKPYLEVRKSTRGLFQNYPGTSVDDLISYSDTENVTDVRYMFRNCSNLQTIPLLDTSNVTNMTYMFAYCRNLTTIPQLDTSNVTYMSYMFSNCRHLQTIDITSMDKITSTSYFNYFASNCYSLTKLIIRTMTTTPTLNTNSFNYCYHFDGTTDSTYNPEGLQDGRIYVPDNMVDSLKTATNWSAFADIIVPLSSLEE